MTTAWVFPGQGSQATGMGLNLLGITGARNKFAQAEQILGWSVLERCQSDSEELSRTLYTQPSLYVVESILVDWLMTQDQPQPDFLAGHSLGEYVALYAAGVFDFEQGLTLVQRRAELMDQAGGGKMTALLGFNREQLEGAIAATEGVVLANDNNPGQVVISGSPEAVDAVLASVKCKRVVPLKVSGAFHSPYMAEPAAQFAELLAQVPFRDATIPVLPNIEPEPITAAEQIKDRLILQMTGSVRWRETILKLAACGVTRLVEVGPGNVLTGLAKRTCESLELVNVNGPVPATV
jgi:[acyl-carrier-protein] S-malonyltransferase